MGGGAAQLFESSFEYLQSNFGHSVLCFFSCILIGYLGLLFLALESHSSLSLWTFTHEVSTFYALRTWYSIVNNKLWPNVTCAPRSLASFFVEWLVCVHPHRTISYFQILCWHWTPRSSLSHIAQFYFSRLIFQQRNYMEFMQFANSSH